MHIPEISSSTMILPLAAENASLDQVGGKGANLSHLARGGYPVPGGFLISVAAYHAAVTRKDLQPQIEAALASGKLDLPQDLEQISQQIRALFQTGIIPADLVQILLQQYRAMGSPAVAVRSSATAEDLPDMSFAGQQDTYLNIQGESSLLQAVADCWGSLWTARAIGYRHRQKVGQFNLALAVVVQEMVQSEASGVLFTANPLTGLRSEIVIDAAFGLGEALVSGKVEPDRYRVDMQTGRLVEKKLGAKALSIRGSQAGGVITVPEDNSQKQALPDEQILALARLGQQVAADFGTPQDIEWAWAGGQLYLLQSRPITSLFPIPDGADPQDLHAFLSFGAVQGMLDPMTALGRDMIRLIFAGGASLFGVRSTLETQKRVIQGGERLWIDITGLLRNPVGRKAARGALNWVEPSIGQNLERVWNDPRLLPTEHRLRFSTLRQLARFALPLFGRVLRNWAAPEKRMQFLTQRVESKIVSFRAECLQASGTREEKLVLRVNLLRRLSDFAPYLAENLISALVAAMSQFVLLRHIGASLDQELDTGTKYSTMALEVTRGIPNNVTTEMDLALWATAQAIQLDPASAAAFQGKSAAQLASAYQSCSLPPAALAAVDSFLERYGLRGVGEIDLGRTRWVEDPTHVMEVLTSYMQIHDPHLAPDVVFARGVQTGEAAARELAEAARRVHGGWFKSRQVRFAARRVRALIGAREAPKFFAIRSSGIVRMGLLDSGREYVQAGLLDQADDLFFLTIRELEAFAHRESGDWQAKISARRAIYEREKQRRQIPRLLLSDGRAFYEGMVALETDPKDLLRGDPVSPGSVEGKVRIVLDPRGAQLIPGEILVCPGTDPAWTPLFLAAGGLVMEVGGLMTHGAVVAREYGIPAVVGVTQATTRLKTGQKIRVNGLTGEIAILE